MWTVEGSWGESVNLLEDVWVLEGDRRVVTERGARRMASDKRAERRSRQRERVAGVDGAEHAWDGWARCPDPDLEAETLAEIADDEAMANDGLMEYILNNVLEYYLYFLINRGATSLHVALVNRIVSRVSQAVVSKGRRAYVGDFLLSRQTELVVKIRAMTVAAEVGTRMVSFLRQLRSAIVLIDSDPEREGDRSELERAAFDPALSMTRLDADLLEAALLAAARTDVDVRAAIAGLFVIETGIGSRELSQLRVDDLVDGETGGQILKVYPRPPRELSLALSGLASALVQRNRAIQDFNGWSRDDRILFQSRESVRSRRLEVSWFSDSLRKMSVDLWRAGLQRRPRSLSIRGLRAHHERRVGGSDRARECFLGWSKRVASTVLPEDEVESPPQRLPVWVLD